MTALVRGLQGAFGGRVVEPLHVTVDRVAAVDADVVVSAVRDCLPRLRRAAIHGNDLFVLRSGYRGADVLKLDVARDDRLDHDIDELRGALRGAGLRPIYGDERSMTVTALERIERSAGLDRAAWGLPIELFVGDTLLVSRIRGVGSYEILDTATVPSSG
ncbi:MAG: hypothetical protein ACRDG6_13590 [Candidatus Limnocylindria bacterium]